MKNEGGGHYLRAVNDGARTVVPKTKSKLHTLTRLCLKTTHFEIEFFFKDIQYISDLEN